MVACTASPVGNAVAFLDFLHNFDNGPIVISKAPSLLLNAFFACSSISNIAGETFTGLDFIPADLLIFDNSLLSI